MAFPSTCGVCGAATNETSCPQCGAAISASAGYDTRVAHPNPPGESTTLFQPRLLGEEGDADLTAPTDLGALAPVEDPTQQIPLFGERTTFGRHGADVNLPDPALSSPHFAVDRTAGAYFLCDLDSPSGTYLNDRRIRSCELAVGDVVRAGTTRLVFVQEPDDDE